MLERLPTRTGLSSVRIDGVTIHSPYDPVREAERFVEASLTGQPPSPPSTVLLLGEGLGYAARAAAARFPMATVIPVFYSEEVFRMSGWSARPFWHPGLPVGIRGFLRSAIGELDVEGLRVAEWPPSARAHPAMAREANRAVQAAVQEANGSIFTTAASGRLWVRNAIENFLLLDSVVWGDPCGRSDMILVAAPGPSLEEALPAIRSCRGSLRLWSLPSAVHTLNAAGLSPDLIVMTDSSHWSMAHLHFARPSCPVAMPLSAARGVWRLGAPVFLLAQPAFYEAELLDRAGVHPPRVAPHGTVAATALDLALASTRATVVLAGLDLCTRDIATHSRPNAFDHLSWLRAGRLTPHHSITYGRARSQPSEEIRRGGITHWASRALRTYAGWLGGEGGRAGLPRVRRLSPSPVALPGFGDLASAELEPLCRGSSLAGPASPAHQEPAYPGRPERLRIVRDLLLAWESEIREGLRLAKTGRGAASIFSSGRLTAIGYFLCAPLLVETRRLLRQDKEAAALDSALRLLEYCVSFIGGLRGKAGL